MVETLTPVQQEKVTTSPVEGLADPNEKMLPAINFWRENKSTLRTDYDGQWVSIGGEGVVASNPNMGKLDETLREMKKAGEIDLDCLVIDFFTTRKDDSID